MYQGVVNFVKDTFFCQSLYDRVIPNQSTKTIAIWFKVMIGALAFLIQTTDLLLPWIQPLLEDTFHATSCAIDENKFCLIDANEYWSKYKYLISVVAMFLHRFIQWLEKNELRDRVDAHDERLSGHDERLSGHDVRHSRTEAVVANLNAEVAEEKHTKSFERQLDHGYSDLVKAELASDIGSNDDENSYTAMA